MARTRMIKPDFFSDGHMASCSLPARLLFIGSWVFADDAGNLDRSAVQLKCRVFPADNIDVEPLIRELVEHGRLIEYSVNGEKYLHIKGFAKHQKIKYPSKPVLPQYQPSPSPPPALHQDQPCGPPVVPTMMSRVGVGEELRSSSAGANAPPEGKSLKTNGHQPPPELPEVHPGDDVSRMLFDNGLRYLAHATARPNAACRGIIGKWLKASGQQHGMVYTLLRQAQLQAVAEPIAWITAALGKDQHGKPTWQSEAARIGAECDEITRRNGG